MVYVCRRILNAAIGPGGWALMPRAHTIVCRNGSYSREFALFCYGNYVAQARGEASYYDKDEPNFGQLDEVAKSNALMRCCKDIGVSSELWDPKFIGPWRDEHATEVWVENISTGVKKKLWRKREARPFGYPYREIAAPPPGGFVSSFRAPQQQPSAANTAAPTSTGSSTGSGGGFGASASTSSPSGAGVTAGKEDEFDINAVVPAGLKKMAGKKWSEVIATSEGRDYLSWIVKEGKNPRTARDAKRALDYAIAVEFDKSS